jgi:exonuclease III
VAADVDVNGHHWGTIIGVYATIRDANGNNQGDGFHSLDRLLDDIDVIIGSRKERVVVAGDFNLWPVDTETLVSEVGLVNVIDYTCHDRPSLEGCVGCNLGSECGHLWTHKNGRADGNGRPQQIDYILCTEDLLNYLETVSGGVQSFSDVLEYSDHAPVVADFEG